MGSIEVAEVAPGQYRLYLVAGTTDVDDVISELGHEPNGSFWEGVVELVVGTEAPALDGRFWTDSEADAFLRTAAIEQCSTIWPPGSVESRPTETACDSWWNSPGAVATSSTTDGELYANEH